MDLIVNQKLRHSVKFRPWNITMRDWRSALLACCLIIFVSGTAVAEDMSIDLHYFPEPATKGFFTHLFISSTHVRFRSRSVFNGNQDWLLNLRDGRLLVIDHNDKTYFESTSEQREKFDSLEREQKETLKALDNWMTRMVAMPEIKVSIEKDTDDAFHGRCGEYNCEVYEAWADAPLIRGQTDLRRLPIAHWTTTPDLSVQEFFKFQDAVRYETCRTGDAWDLALRIVYDQFKKNGMFPLASNPSSGTRMALTGTTILPPPNYAATDLLFYPVVWGVGDIRKGAIDPAIFTVVPTDSIMSPVLPASYKKIDSPLAECIVSLQEQIKSNKELAARLNKPKIDEFEPVRGPR